jgi:hypothetical protein
MAKFNEKEVKEINATIADIQKAIDIKKSSNCKIGAGEKVTVLALLKANSIPSSAIKFFKCKREHSGTIVSHFVGEKGMKRSRFSMNLKEYVYIIDGEGDQ